MARSSTSDPLDKFRWTVEIDGFSRLGFTSVQTPSINIATKEYAEGGAHFYPKVIIDSVSYSEIALERGVTKDTSFTTWMSQLFSSTSKANPDPFDFRKEVIISHLDRTGKVVKRYRLFNAIPVEYKPASDFSADADDTLSIERLVLKYEGFSVESPAKEAGILEDFAGGAKNIAKKLFRGL